MTAPLDRARWLLQAGPADYAMAISVASAQLPLVGRHLEPLGAATAMSVWGYRHLPDFLRSTARSWLSLGAGDVRRSQRESTNEVAQEALRGLVSPADLETHWPGPERVPPLWKAFEHRRHLYRTSVRYGSHPAQRLDVWRRRHLPAEPAPVLLFIPGGAWVHGSRLLQGYALMSHLAAKGWVCLSIDYRVAPHHRWPSHINDVKAAIAWARANVDRFGGDRDFVAVAGCSAGGHLAALAGLTADDAEYQEHLPAGSDTSVDAVVGVYGRYDWEDRSTAERERFVDFLERIVVDKRQDRHGAVFRKASPIAQVHPDAPPFLIVHGSTDTVIPVEQARGFVERLRSVSSSPVGYVELPGAGHGFDMIDGARTGSVVCAIGLFLNKIHRDHNARSAKEAI
ncbi:MAG: alpha/beta hydrolase [Mycobacterium sp.]